MPMPAPLLAPLTPSLVGGFALFGKRDSAVVIPTYTNAQKLSLSPATAIGTQVKVSDGFVMSGGYNGDGFQRDIGALNGRRCYQNPVPVNGVYWGVAYTGTAWAGYTSNVANEIGDAGDVAPPDAETNPWDSANLADFLGVTLTHPAVQQLASPSSAQGGVFVSGGTQNGIYTDIGIFNTKKAFGLLGISNGDPTTGLSVGWYSDINGSFAVGPSSSGFVFLNGNTDAVYYSLSDVATPDLATNWKNASDDSPASITVTSVTGGQVAAGMKLGSDFYAVTTPVNGRNAYHDVLGVAPDFTFNGTIWTDGTHNGTGVPAFPWSVTGITITQDNVASETNWTNV